MVDILVYTLYTVGIIPRGRGMHGFCLSHCRSSMICAFLNDFSRPLFKASRVQRVRVLRFFWARCFPASGVVRDSNLSKLGLEIDVSTSGSDEDTLGHFEE